jgi:hypothetical protein
MCCPSKRSSAKPVLVLVAIILAVSCQPGKKDLATAQSMIAAIQCRAIVDSRTAPFSVQATWADGRVLLQGRTTVAQAANDLVQGLKDREIACTDRIVRLPDPALGDKTWGLVTISVANIRYAPDQTAEMASQGLMGTPLRVLQEENGWYLVQTPDRYIAWTERDGITLQTQGQMDAWKRTARLIFLGDSGLILAGPGADSLPISDIVTGDIVVREGDDKGRGPQAVRLPDGRKGFVSGPEFSDFLEWSDSVAADPQRLVAFARRMQGRPYLWGGTSVKGFDCSGFTKTIYLTGGLILARDASQQALQGTAVGEQEIWQGLKAGDLLFFGRRASAEKGEHVSHVGMYLGESRFIHCSGMVRVNSLDPAQADYKPLYRANLLHVRRMIGAADGPPAIKTHPWFR